MVIKGFYQNKGFTTENVGASELYLLSWIDAIERLDILLLESRHLQINIINHLREPALLLALRYEESYLWGNKWEENLKEDTPKDLAKKWIISYPDRKQKNEEKEPKNDRDKIKGKLNALLDKIWHKGGWSQEQRANYYSLKAIQLLKMEILRDKLELTYHALFISKLHQFLRDDQKVHALGGRNKRAEFMILRGAILYQASKDYVERLRDYQYQFVKNVDTFVDDTASSNKYRRRDIGVYTDFLRDRTIGIYTEIEHLLKHLNIKKEEQKESLILHNWMHSYTSKSRYYKNVVSDENVTHITTNYWMPERPDLQPIIAHEIAHKFIKSSFGDISHGKISYLDDDFSLLLLRIYAKIDDFSNNPFDIILDPKAITRELSCDFIATSVKGIRYIYAHFIEFLGSDISFFGSLTRNGKDIDYNNLGHFSYKQLDQFYDSRLWYLRIKITLKWLSAVHHSSNSVLDNELIDGIYKVIQDILDFYKSLAVTDREAKQEGFWEELTEQLADIISSPSSTDITEAVKTWRLRRSNDVFHRDTGEKNPSSRYPRSVARIDLRVRNMLYKTQLHMKTKEGRLLHKINKNEPLIHQLFEKVYGVGFHFDENKNFYEKQRDDSSPLYRYIYDIVWQSCLMRAKDLLFKISDNKIVPKRNHSAVDTLNAIHFEFPMGRDLFAFALEFSMFDHESPHDRLMTIAYLLNPENGKLNIKDNSLYSKIKEWYEGSARPPYGTSEPESIDGLLKRIKNEDRGTAEHRQTNRDIGRKIMVLFNLLGEKKLDKKIIPLYYFLKTKDKGKTSKKNLFHDILLSGFSLRNNGLDRLPMGYIIGDISISSSYAQLRRKDNLDDKKTATYNLLDHRQILKKPSYSWYGEGSKVEKSCYYFKQLGHYDVMFINQATSLTRCALPGFLGTKESINEKFPSFFSKKEMAIPFLLGNKPWNEVFCEEQILITLRIKLKQRSYRLNFLYRLRNSCLNSDMHHNNSIEGTAKKFQIAANQDDPTIEIEDCAFLIDSSDDIVLLFMAKEKKETVTSDEYLKKRLDDILSIQNSIYQDFMVDRTRLSFTQNCLQAIRMDNKYKAFIFIRLLEDRHLNFMNRNYLDDIKKKNLGIKLYKISGEYDYYSDITKLIKNNKDKEINDILNDLCDSKYIDSINTHLLHSE